MVMANALTLMWRTAMVLHRNVDRDAAVKITAEHQRNMQPQVVVAADGQRAQPQKRRNSFLS
jgi:hypothetical protein